MTNLYQKLLIFSLGIMHYGVSILDIKEIIGMVDIVSIPNTPDFIKGVIKLREKIMPVMDLRIKFGIEPKEYDSRTCIIVVETYINEVRKLFGVIVDDVSDVITFPNEQIEPPPEYGVNLKDNFILGIGKAKDKVVIILDIYKVFANEDVKTILENLKESPNIMELENV